MTVTHESKRPRKTVTPEQRADDIASRMTDLILLDRFAKALRAKSPEAADLLARKLAGPGA